MLLNSKEYSKEFIVQNDNAPIFKELEFIQVRAKNKTKKNEID